MTIEQDEIRHSLEMPYELAYIRTRWWMGGGYPRFFPRLASSQVDEALAFLGWFLFIAGSQSNYEKKDQS